MHGMPFRAKTIEILKKLLTLTLRQMLCSWQKGGYTVKKAMIFVISALLALLIGCGAKEPEPLPVSPTPEAAEDRAGVLYSMLEVLPWEDCTALNLTMNTGMRQSESLTADTETLRELLSGADWYYPKAWPDELPEYVCFLEINYEGKRRSHSMRFEFRGDGITTMVLDEGGEFESYSFTVRNWEELREGLDALWQSMPAAPERDMTSWTDCLPWESCADILYIRTNEDGKHTYAKPADPLADAAALRELCKETVWEIPELGFPGEDRCVVQLTWADGTKTTLRFTETGNLADPENTKRAWMKTKDMTILDQLDALVEAAASPVRSLLNAYPWEECTKLTVKAYVNGRLQVRRSEDPLSDAEALRQLLADADWYIPEAWGEDWNPLYTLELSGLGAKSNLTVMLTERGELLIPSDSPSNVQPYIPYAAVRDWETLREELDALRRSLYIRPDEDVEGWMDAFPWEDCADILYIRTNADGTHTYARPEDPMADAAALHRILQETVWLIPTCGNRNGDLYSIHILREDGLVNVLLISDAGEVADPNDIDRPWMYTTDLSVLEKIGALIEEAPPM